MQSELCSRDCLGRQPKMCGWLPCCFKTILFTANQAVSIVPLLLISVGCSGGRGVPPGPSRCSCAADSAVICTSPGRPDCSIRAAARCPSPTAARTQAQTYQAYARAHTNTRSYQPQQGKQPALFSFAIASTATNLCCHFQKIIYIQKQLSTFPPPFSSWTHPPYAQPLLHYTIVQPVLTTSPHAIMVGLRDTCACGHARLLASDMTRARESGRHCGQVHPLNEPSQTTPEPISVWTLDFRVNIRVGSVFSPISPPNDYPPSIHPFPPFLYGVLF